MNKRRYRLIFSRTKSCLVPVAEFMKTVTESNLSKKSIEGRQIEIYRLSFISNAVSHAIKTMKYIPVFLFPMPVAFANNPSVVVDEKYQDKTKITITENRVVLVDIAKPEYDGISDNRFSQFTVENGAVFKNNMQEAESTLVKHLEKNPHLEDKAASAILTQVTGTQSTTLHGGLEVLGQKADLFIVNPNGVTINGVQTFNTDRFVVSTSQVIEPSKGLNLNVAQGQVTITEKGLSTEGLSYVDIVAKKIEQKGAIKPNTTGAHVKPANITLVAGSAEYNVTTGCVTAKSVLNESDVILTGGEAGSMYGDKIRFIVTDTGAGVNHQGIILSSSDVEIEMKKGDIRLNQLHANNLVEIKNGKDFTLKKDLNANKVHLDSEKAILQKATLEAKANANVTTQALELKDKSKFRTHKAKLNVTNLSTDAGSEVIATDLNVTANNIFNNGTISAANNRLDTSYLRNQGTILAKENVSISVIGEQNKTYRKENEFKAIQSQYINLGSIQSEKDARLTFKNNTSFSAVAHLNKGLPQAKNSLTVDADYFEVEQGQKIELDNNVTINSEHFINNGLLTTGGYLKVSSHFDIENSGLLGAGKGYHLVSNNSNITNNVKGILHSQGTSLLDSVYKVVNDGKIISRDKLTVNTRYLLNNATLSGELTTPSSTHHTSLYYRRNSARNDLYQLEMRLNDFNASNLKITNMGQIRAEGDFEFIQKPLNGDEFKGIDNFGVINVQGRFNNNGTDRIHNGIKGISKNLIDDYFNNYSVDVILKFQPRSQLLFLSGPLSGQTSAQYATLGQFLDGLLSRDETLRSSAYSGYYHEYLKLLKNIESEQLQNALTQVLGQNWDTQNREVLKAKWEEAKSRKDQWIHFYPSSTAKILAKEITGSITHIQNGQGGQSGQFDHSINVGEHSIHIPKVSFKTFNTQEIEQGADIDLSILIGLLSETDLFIDRSLQFLPNTPPLVDASEEESARKERERQALEKRKQQELAEQRKREEEKRQRELAEAKKKREAEEKARQEQLEKERKAFEERQRQEQEALAEKLRKEAEERDRLQREKAAQEKQKREEAERQKRLEAEKRQRELEAERRRLEEEKQRLAEKERARLAEEERRRLAEEQKRIEEEQKRLAEQERQRKEAERQRLEEQERQRQEAERQRLADIERQKRELAERQEQERRALEEKARLEKEAREKAFQEQVNALLVGSDRPRVQVDPLYHTRVKYI
ncbi:MAG: filamentous hemagglutinin N-terminal domain-containing protein, partial [Pasteurellaceae bacterium]|nr:filamentous hemagglutinin N-terminal domain-containing protein [Pasteurellaceae bacterium]